MKIEILGTGCAKCESLAAKAEAAARTLGIEFELCKVRDINEIMKRGVVFTPALAIDGEVKVSGKIPSDAEITTIIADGMGSE